MSDSSLKTARTGVTLVYIGLLLAVLCFIAFLAVAYVPALAARASELLRYAYYTFIAANIFTILGMVLCLGAPSESPGKWAIFLAAPLECLSTLFFLGLAFQIQFVVDLWLDNPKLMTYAWAAWVAGLGFFLLFLKGLSEHVSSADCPGIAVGAMIVFGILVAIGLAGEFLLKLLVRAMPQNALEIAWIYIVVVLVFLAIFVMRYGRLLTFLRRDIGRAMEGDTART